LKKLKLFLKIFLEVSRLEEMKGCPVAIATSGITEGAVFKRIGESVPRAPHVRLFESIGGLGESMLVRIEDIGGTFGGLPVLRSVRRVVGVLYEFS
jgi:hypothetical protein